MKLKKRKNRSSSIWLISANADTLSGPHPPFKQVKLMKSKVTNENWVWFVCYQFQLQLAYYAYAVFAWGCEKAKAKAKGVINFNKNCSKVSCLRLKRGRWEKGGGGCAIKRVLQENLWFCLAKCSVLPLSLYLSLMLPSRQTNSNQQLHKKFNTNYTTQHTHPAHPDTL